MGVTLTRSVRAVTGTGGTCPSLFVLLYSVSARCALGLAHTLHLWHLPVLESNGNYHTSLSLPARGLNAAGRSSRVTPRYVGRVLEIRKISEQAIALGRARARKAHNNPLLAICEAHLCARTSADIAPWFSRKTQGTVRYPQTERGPKRATAARTAPAQRGASPKEKPQLGVPLWGGADASRVAARPEWRPHELRVVEERSLSTGYVLRDTRCDEGQRPVRLASVSLEKSMLADVVGFDRYPYDSPL